MSRIENWSEMIDALKLTQEERNNLLKIEGVLEMAQKAETNPLAQMLATALLAVIKDIRLNDLVHTRILDVFSTLISQQEREIDMLKSITKSLASEREDLSKKFEEMDKWRKEREPMLTAIDEIVNKRREWLNQNR